MSKNGQNKQSVLIIKKIKDCEKLLRYMEQSRDLLYLLLEKNSIVELSFLAYWLSPIKKKLALLGLFLFLGGVSGFGSFVFLFISGGIGIVSTIVFSVVVGLLSGWLAVSHVLLSDMLSLPERQLIQEIKRLERLIRHVTKIIDELRWKHENRVY